MDSHNKIQQHIRDGFYTIVILFLSKNTMVLKTPPYSFIVKNQKGRKNMYKINKVRTLHESAGRISRLDAADAVGVKS